MREPWLRFDEAAKRLRIGRTTLYRLIDEGILRRSFTSRRARGVTLESIAEYEAGIAYLNQREAGQAEPLPWQSQQQSPLYHLLVTGRYRRSAVASAASAHDPGLDDGAASLAPVRGGATRGVGRG